MDRWWIVPRVKAAALASLLLAAPGWAEHDEPSEGLIAFVSARTGSSDVWAMHSDGTNPVDLTAVPGADLWPAYSPDGQRIAFTRGAGFARELWLMNADGTAPVRLTTNGSGENAPEWSPDGRHIAVARFAPDFTVDIWVVAADGSEPDRQLTHDADFDSFPTWSPDGRWIAFSSDREGHQAVWRIRADGTGGLERLTAPELEAGTPEWSHDGKYIAFVDNVCASCDESDIWLLKLDNRKLIQVTDTPENELFPDWSPDDKWLAYERSDIVDGTLLLPDVFVTSVKHGTAINLTNSPGVLDFQPTWHPGPREDDDVTGGTLDLGVDCLQAGVSNSSVDVFDLTLVTGPYAVRARGLNDQQAICYESETKVKLQSGQTQSLTMAALQHPLGSQAGCVYPGPVELAPGWHAAKACERDRTKQSRLSARIHASSKDRPENRAYG